MTLHRIAYPSPNYSARGSSDVSQIVLHTAEGSRTIESLGSFFANPSAGVSSHAGADDKANTIGVYVHREHKAWTQANANPRCVSIEMCAFAAWDRAEWDRHPNMLANVAQWVAEESAFWGIPLTRLSAAMAQGGVPGVCQHIDLGAVGGGHVDCDYGSGAFPMDRVLTMAAGGGGATPTTRKGHNMIASTSTGEGYWTVTSDGAIGAFGDAEYHGGAFDFEEDTPGRQPMAPGTTIIGIAGKGRDGYWLYASDGGVFTFGSAQFYGRPDRA